MDNLFSIQYQAKTEAPFGFISPIQQFESAWHEPWSEPVRQRILPALAIALAASGLFAPVLDKTQQPGNNYESAYHQQWSEPVRVKPHFLVGTEPFSSWDPRPPLVSFAFYNWLTEPVRQKLGLGPQFQQYTSLPFTVLPPPSTLLQGYNWLSEPVRLKPGLGPQYQQWLAYHPRLLPKPNVTATMSALETNQDVFSGAINVSASIPTPTISTGARVSVIEVISGVDPVSIRES